MEVKKWNKEMNVIEGNGIEGMGTIQFR